MAGEPRFIGSLIGIDLSSTTEQQIPMNSSRYVMTDLYLTNQSQALSFSYEIWTGPGKTGTKIAGGGLSAMPSPDKIRSLPASAIPSGGLIGTVMTDAILYWTTTVPHGTGMTGDVYATGFDLP